MSYRDHEHYTAERPENLVYAKPSPKALRTLASGELDHKEHHEFRHKLLRTNDRAYEKALRTGWGMSRDRANDLSDRYRKQIFEASEAGDAARKVRYARETHESYQKAREAQPRPGTYEHELALMRGRSASRSRARRGRARARRRSRR